MTHLTKSAPKQKPKSFSFEAIGTHWYVEYDGVDIGVDIEKIIFDRIDVFDKTYSRFRNDTLVSKIANNPGTYDFPDDAVQLFDFYDQLYSATSGLVTPLVGNTLSDAGYDAQYSLSFKQKTIAPKMSDVISRVGNRMTISQPIILDVGAAGKGYLVDIVSKLLRSNGAHNAMVNAGGDITVFSDNSFVTEIALQHPGNNALSIGTVLISSGSLCGSSINVRNWGTHHHIINPRTAASPLEIQAVWVSADNAMLADGLSTALFFVDPDQLKPQFKFEYAIIKDDDSLQYSHNFPATFFE